MNFEGLTARSKFKIETVRKIMDKNAELMNAVCKDDYETVERILNEGGVDPNYRDKFGSSLLEKAMALKSKRTVSLLLKYGSDPNSRDEYYYTPGIYAAERGYVDLLDPLTSHGVDFTLTDKIGRTPAHVASVKGQVEVLKRLKSYGINLEIKDKFGRTPAHLAAQNGEVGVLVLLKSFNINFDVTDENGDTSLHKACFWNKRDAVMYLMKNGCDIHTVNKKGISPLQFLKSSKGSVEKERIETLNEVQAYLEAPTFNTSGTALKFSQPHISHIKAFEEAILRKGSLTCFITQCMPFGLPRVGKTCLYHRLLDRIPPGRPTTHDELGSGSESTNVLTKRRMIQVKINPESSKTDRAIVAEGNEWNEVSTLQEEIAIYLKSVHSQCIPINISSSSEVSVSVTVASMGVSPSKPSHAHPTPANYKVNVLDEDLASNANSQLDDAVLDAIMGKIKNKEVDMEQVQGLLDKSLTIFYTDTGGQPEFHEVMPALAAGPMVFLLAFNLYEPLQKIYNVRYVSSKNVYEPYESSCTVKEVLMQCLSSIVSYNEAQSRQCIQYHSAGKCVKLSQPPIKILVIGTHSDLVTEEHIAEINKSFEEAVADTVVEHRDMIEYFDRETLIIPVNNYDPADGGKIREVFDRAVKRKIEGDSPYKVELPVHWLGLELYLRQREGSIISYKNCLKVGKKLGIQEEEFASCLWYLHHRMGTIRYYSDLEELQDTIITEPNVLYVAVTEFITSTFTLKNVGKLNEKNFHKLGLFKAKTVEHIFNEHKDSLKISFKQFIALLEYLNILGPAHDENFDYFFPCALAHAPLFETEQKINVQDSLLASFSNGFVPKGVVSGVLAILCKNGWIIKQERRKPLLFRNQATFAVNGFCITMTARAKYLEFIIESQNASDVSDIFYSTQITLKKAIEDALKRLGYGSDFIFGFYCSINCGELEPHFARLMNDDFTKAECQVTKQKFELEKKQKLWFSSIQSGDLAVKLKQIENRTNESAFSRAQGIIFIVGIYGADGTAKDVENVEKTFKELNFAIFIERDPTSAQIACLVEAATMCNYPFRYEYIAFYFAGHGGKDISTGQMFIKGLQLDESKPEILNIEKFIVDPLKKVNRLKKLCFFDCCQTPGEGKVYRDAGTPTHNPKQVPLVLIAYSTSDGQKSFGDNSKGGIWTYHLCKNLKNQEPITRILIKTSNDVAKLRREFQEPTTVCSDEFHEVILHTGSLQAHSTETSQSSRNSPIPEGYSVDIDKQDQQSTIICSESVLLQKPKLSDAYKLLKGVSNKWNEIGRALDVDFNFREGLKSKNQSNDDLLELILHRWLESATVPPTWSLLLRALEEAELCEVARFIKQWIDTGSIK